MPWKTDEAGQIVVENGNPVWIGAEGKEIAYDPNVTHSRLTSVRSDAQKRQERITELEQSLAALEWAGKSSEEIEQTKAELEELRAAKRKAARKKPAEGEDDTASEELQEKLYQLEQQIETLNKRDQEHTAALERAQSTVQQLTVGSEFRNSAWFSPWTDDEGQQRKPKTLLEPTAAEALFGGHFRPAGENGGSVVATWTPGDKDTIYSEAEPGKPASFDEAFGLLFNRWEKKSHYLPHGSPGGMNLQDGGPGGADGGGKISRAKFDALSPDAQRKHLKEGGEVVDSGTR